MQPQGKFGDQTQSALGPDHERRQIIARRRLRRAGAGVDHLAIGQNHLQPAHIVAHRAIAHRRRPRGPRRRHPAKRGICPRIDREHQPCGPQLMVQRLARDPGLDADQAVLHALFHDRRHLAEIHHHAARKRQRMPLKRSSRPPADQRHKVAGGPAGKSRDLICRGRKDHGIGQTGSHQAFALPVFGQHSWRNRQPPGKQGAQLGKGGIGQHASDVTGLVRIRQGVAHHAAFGYDACECHRGIAHESRRRHLPGLELRP